jgi:DNA-binding NtrC family response regulator
VKACVLLVDDEANVRESLKRILRKEPYEVVTADSGITALDVLASRRIDVVVSDESMPYLPGSKFLGIVRQKYPSTVRIMLTGHASLESAIRAINEGEVFRFLTKPCNHAEMLRAIRDGLLTKNLVDESTRLLTTARQRRTALDDLERQYPGITRVNRLEGGHIPLNMEINDTNLERLIEDLRSESET